MESEIEKLQQELLETQKKLKELKKKEKNSKRSLAIRDLSEITDKEKIEFFDMQYKSSLEELKRYEKEKYHDEDEAHYCWESCIVISR
jgi:hypothetical protein